MAELTNEQLRMLEDMTEGLPESPEIALNKRMEQFIKKHHEHRHKAMQNLPNFVQKLPDTRTMFMFVFEIGPYVNNHFDEDGKTSNISFEGSFSKYSRYSGLYADNTIFDLEDYSEADQKDMISKAVGRLEELDQHIDTVFA